MSYLRGQDDTELSSFRHQVYHFMEGMRAEHGEDDPRVHAAAVLINTLSAELDERQVKRVQLRMGKATT